VGSGPHCGLCSLAFVGEFILKTGLELALFVLVLMRVRGQGSEEGGGMTFVSFLSSVLRNKLPGARAGTFFWGLLLRGFARSTGELSVYSPV
jgi:hypothetical protein